MSDKITKHGGQRKGAGRRPKNAEAMTTQAVLLTEFQRRTAERIGGGNVSAGVRILIDAGIASIASIVPTPGKA